MAFNFSPKIVTNGLVLYLDAANGNSYPRSGTTWTDLSGNSNTVSLLNGPTFNSANAGSIVFDGTNDFATASNSTSLNSFTTGLTVTLWTKINAGFVDNDVLITKSNITATNGWGIYYTSNFIRFFLTTVTGGTFQQVSSSFTTADTTPVNWAGVYNGANIILYKNGVLDRVGPTLTTAVSNSNGAMSILGTSTSATPANLYTTQIYNRALTAAEVLQNYNATKGRFGL